MLYFSSEDYCCILCGYKEQSVDRLKDHINLHFIGQVKRKHEQTEDKTNKNGNSSEETPVKKIKSEPESTDVGSKSPNNPKSPQSPIQSTSRDSGSDSEERQLKCNSCEIGFTHLSNFVAHKKYYCRGGTVNSAIPSKSSSQPSPNASEIKVSNGEESPK